MEVIFSPIGATLLKQGVLKLMESAEGLRPILINPATGKIFEIGKLVGESTQNQGIIINLLNFIHKSQYQTVILDGNSFSPLSLASRITSQSATGPLTPFVAPAQLILGPAQMIQNHLGFQETYRMIEGLGRTLAALQATTAVIGVGVAAGLALSSVNLYQTLQLRKDIQQLRLEVRDGFVDLKSLLREQHESVLAGINQLEFKHHRLELAKAYAHFLAATKLIGLAAECEAEIRNAHLTNAAQTLGNALEIYNSPHLLLELSAPAKLRRFECAWAIEQTLALTFQLQNQPAAVSKCLANLHQKMQQDALLVIEQCQSTAELDFIFPELVRIQAHDWLVLEIWMTQVDVWRSLPAAEVLTLLESVARAETAQETSLREDLKLEEGAIDEALQEQLLYEQLKQKSHFESLRDQLKLIIKPELRQQYEAFIQQQGPGYQSLGSSNWQEVSTAALVNFYWYLKQVKSV